MQAAPQATTINTTTSAASLQSSSLGTLPNGDCVIVFVEMDATSAGTFTMVITDTAGNTYTQIASYQNPNANKRLSAWYSTNIIGGATFKVTATPSTAAALALACFWIPGAKLVTPIDGNASTTGSSTSPAAGNTGVTNNNELIITGFSSVATGTITATAPTGYTQGPSNLAGTTLPIIDTAYNVVPSGTTNPTWTIVSAAWAAIACSITNKLYPVVLIDSNTGSDTLSSGAGPSTAKNGSLAATDTTGRIVTITDASMDLSTVALDGSAVLRIIDTTAGHVNWSQIGNIVGSIGNWTVTCVTAFGASQSGKSWAIGGQLASVSSNTGNALSFRLINNNSAAGDAQPGWIMQFRSAHSETSSATVRFFRSGDAINGPITLQGDPAASTLPKFIFSNNGAALQSSGNYITIQNFEIQNSNVTKTASIAMQAINGMANCRIIGLKCNDATNFFWKFCDDSQNAGDNWVIESCSIGNCANNAIDFSSSVNPKIRNNEIFKCGGIGISGVTTHVNNYEIIGNTITFCTGDGIKLGSSSPAPTTEFSPNIIDGNVLHGNGGAGLEITNTNINLEVLTEILIQNNRFTFNVYGINFSGSCISDLVLTAAQALIRNNNFNGNTTGKYNGMTVASSVNEDTSDPSGGLASTTKDYAGTTNGRNFMSNVDKALAWPIGGTQHVGDTGLTAGNYGGASYQYKDFGLQHQDPGGFLPHATVVTNIGTY